jgi:hypothetical protein
MNLYDPAGRIYYVYLSGPAEDRPTVADAPVDCRTLPPGYANRSPRTLSPLCASRDRGPRPVQTKSA